MKIADILSKAHAMPLTNPAYPKGPYRFYNREYLIVTYRTDMDALRAVVPEPLEIADAIFLSIGEEYDWDMEVASPAGQITPVRLGGTVQLGWTSWMAPNWSKSDETIRRDAHFHVTSRLDRRRRGTKPG